MRTLIQQLLGKKEEKQISDKKLRERQETARNKVHTALNEYFVVVQELQEEFDRMKAKRNG